LWYNGCASWVVVTGDALALRKVREPHRLFFCLMHDGFIGQL